MNKNIAGKWTVFAFGSPAHATLAGLPITGNAAQITANIRLDGGAANAVDDTNPTELEDGYYVFDITAAEANADLLTLAPASSTGDVIVIGVPGAIYTRPANFNALGIEADGDVTKVNLLNGHTAQTADHTAGIAAIPTTAMRGTDGVDTATMRGTDGVDTTAMRGTDNVDTSNLTVAGSASKVPAKLSPNGFAITWGENEVNTEDATRPLDGITHDLEAQNDAGTERIDAYYEVLNIGAGVPSEVTWHGRLDKGGGATKNILVQVEDVDASTWRTIGTVESSTSLETRTFDIFINEVGTGADLGTVRIRFVTGDVAFTSTTKLITDQIFHSFNAGTISGLDAVYFDSAAGNTGVTSNDGVPGNPVSSEAAVNTLLAARNLNRVVVAIASSITFTTTHAGEEWTGDGWTLALGNQNIAASLIIGATVSGIHTGAAKFTKCELGTLSTAGMTTNDCGHAGTITITAAGTYIFNNSHSEVAGATTPVIDMGAAVGNVDLAMPDYHNGIEIQNLNTAGADKFSISGIGQIVYAASSTGAVNQRGDWKVTNTGGVTITADDNTTNAAATLSDSNAIKVVTDKFGFTLANHVDANVRAVTNAPISQGGAAPASKYGIT